MEEPLGHWRKPGATGGPPVALPAPVAAGRRDDVAGLAADVETVAHLAGRGRHSHAWMCEVSVPATTGSDPGSVERRMGGDEGAQRTHAGGAVDVEHNELTWSPGANADVRARDRPPPGGDQPDAGRGVVQPVR